MDIYQSIISVLGSVSKLVEDDRKLESEMKNLLSELTSDMRIMNAFIKDRWEKGVRVSATYEAWMLELQNLAYDIEDIKDLQYHKAKPPRLGRMLCMATQTDRRPTDIDTFKGLKDRCRRLSEWMQTLKDESQGGAGDPNKGGGCSGGGGIATPATASTSSTNSPESSPGASSSDGSAEPPVGVENSIRDLDQLLDEEAEGQPRELRVVSIVGCRGLGKTTLAKVLYDRRRSEPKQFDYHAWVPIIGASSRSSTDNAAYLLREILQQVDPKKAAKIITSNLNKIHEVLKAGLKNKRYFFVLDDLRDAEVWNDIKSAFPGEGTSSRIIVTTSIQSVAAACSSGSYVYRLQRLDLANTKKLLWRNVFSTDDDHQTPRPDVDSDSGDICSKCDGLPLAVISVAQFLRSKGNDLEGTDCKDVAHGLARHLALGEDGAFEKVHRVLVECFQGLSSFELKRCLLSMSMFPKGHEVKKKSLVRRWIAEGLVAKDDQLNQSNCARKGLKELFDRSILEPAQTTSGAVHRKRVAKRCHVHGVMLEFLVGESGSRHFASLIKNGKLMNDVGDGCSVRRLSVQESNKDLKDSGIPDVSHIRSLTIVGNDLVDFQGCELMRVLDLENCKGVDDCVLHGICRMPLLKYLSLRGTDTRRLPRKMKRLRNLETLDVRDLQTTDVIQLPLEIILLPQLAYLYGAFELPRGLTSKKASGIAKSQLHTLSGFVISDSSKNLQGFKYILDHMKTLRKVKIWWKSTSAPSDHLTKLLATSLEKRFSGSNGLDSLALDFGHHQSLDLLDCLALDAGCTLDSIKLRGRLTKIPAFIVKKSLMTSLSEVHLTSTGLPANVLSDLQWLGKLMYMKITEDKEDFGNGFFHVSSEGFKSLIGLFIQAPKLPHLRIDAGGMENLASLQLLCDNVNGFPLNSMEHLKHLDQVLLKSSLRVEKDDEWNAEAKKHKHRPRIDYHIPCKDPK